MNKQGVFITLEGVEGAGKSTLMEYVGLTLGDSGHEVVLTREPGGTKTGEQIRNILLDSSNIGLSKETELLLMFSARMQHIQEVIAPAIAANKIVVCDRFTDASYAYQGGGRGIESDKIKTLENWVQESLTPDLTLLFDLDVKVGLRRAGRRSQEDRFEQEEIGFFEKIRACYLARADKEPGRFRIVDASQSFEEVKQQISEILKQHALC